MPEFIYPQKFTFIDLEIPNLNNDRICAVSLIVVEDRKEVLRHTELINPMTFFSPQNVAIHKIRRKDVLDKRTLEQFWDEYKKYFTDEYILVAHNAMSDISVLNKDLARLKTSIPATRYIDTMDLCQYYLRDTELRKGDLRLDGLARRFGIHLDHHDPESDVNACYEIVKYLGWFHQFDIKPFIRTIRPGRHHRFSRRPTAAGIARRMRRVRYENRNEKPRAGMSLEQLEKKGQEAMHKGSYEEAVVWFETAAARKSLSPWVYANLAEIYGEYGLFTEAFYIINLGINRLSRARINNYALVSVEKKLKKARALRGSTQPFEAANPLRHIAEKQKESLCAESSNASDGNEEKVTDALQMTELQKTLESAKEASDIMEQQTKRTS